MSAKKKPVQDCLINLVLDKSGSMGPLAEATKEGVNAFLDEQRALPGKTYLSLTLFDTTFEVRHVGLDLTEVPVLGSAASRYTPNGGTALYDAVAATIQGTDAWLVKHPEFTGRVVCVINTDGVENSSRTTSLDQVNHLITERTQAGWDFVFMGAGQAAWTEGTKFTSIPDANFMSYAATGQAMSSNVALASHSLSHSRSTGARYTGSNVGPE